MELLAPAGSIEKLSYAYLYGADAAYIGIKNFSLRARADNFRGDEYKRILKLKGDKKLYGALNIYFQNKDLRNLEENLEYLKEYPFDAFIISDIGVVPILRKNFPDVELHLSTQANCLNIEAARIYKDMGFSRIIPGRELSLKEIAEIKQALPELEIEVFIHGAMCLAYSGRCFLSKYFTDRSANKGDCAHSCRWKYRVLEEEERQGEFFPVLTGENFTTVMSSKDICMIDHIAELEAAGVDSLKIEGRMKSIYYTAVITRGYRKMIDSIQGSIIKDLNGFRDEIFKVSHREFTTGFFFDKKEIEIPTEKSYLRQYMFLGSIGKKLDNGSYELDVKNQILSDDSVEYIGPDILYIEDNNFLIHDENHQQVSKADHGKIYSIRTDKQVKPGYIIRRKLEQP